MSEPIKAIARRVGPETSRKAAESIKAVRYREVFEALKKLRRDTCEGVILYLKKTNAKVTLREDSISGMFNLLCMAGKVVPTGKKKPNTSKMSAMVWRIATPEETAWLKKYVGTEKPPWPSPDKLLAMKEVQDVLKNHRDPEVRRMYRRYRKGIRFKTILKDKGIKFFMANYETNGKKKEQRKSI